MRAFLRSCRALAGLLAVLATPAAQSQGPTAPLELTGFKANTRKLSAATLAALPHQEVTATEKDGSTHRYAGVPLAELLKLAAVPQGKELHGPVLRQALLVRGADDYTVVFALPELDAAFASQTVLLADQCDGQPLAADNGPYQVIVPQEKRPTRWVRQARSLRVVQVN